MKKYLKYFLKSIAGVIIINFTVGFIIWVLGSFIANDYAFTYAKSIILYQFILFIWRTKDVPEYAEGFNGATSKDTLIAICVEALIIYSCAYFLPF